MKSFKLIVAFILLAFTANMNAADYKDLLKANLEARGGKALTTIKTVYAESEMSAMGNVMPTKFWAENPTKYATEISQMGQTMKLINDGTKVFSVMGGQAQDIPEDQAKLAILQNPDVLIFQENALVNNSICNDKNTTLAKDSLEGKLYDVIRVKHSPILEISYFIDPATKLEVAYGFKLIESDNKEMNAEFKEINESKPVLMIKEWMLVNGIKFPKVLDLNLAGMIISKAYSKIELNKKIDSKVFQK